MLPSVISRIDKLAKKHIIHVNKAARQKSQLARQVASLAA
jgi:small subunit ribosomal protein S20